MPHENCGNTKLAADVIGYKMLQKDCSMHFWHATLNVRLMRLLYQKRLRAVKPSQGIVQVSSIS